MRKMILFKFKDIIDCHVNVTLNQPNGRRYIQESGVEGALDIMV